MPLQLVLDRVLDGDDLVFDGFDFGQRRVEGRRLTAPRGPGDENHAVRLGNVFPEALELGLGEPQDVQSQLAELLADRFLVEDADDGIFPVHAGHDRDAKIDGLARKPELETSVLRDALLGDVELRHDFDAGDDRAGELPGNGSHGRLQNPVDAVFDVNRIVLCLDVNVAGAALNGGVDRRVDELDDGADVARQPLDGQLVFANFLLAQELQLKALGSVLENTLRALALLENRLNGRPRAHGDSHGRAEQERQFVDHRQIARIRDDDHQGPAVAAVRHEAVSQHEISRNGPEKLLVDPEFFHIDELQAVPLGQATSVGQLGRRV